jgi:hypothetical protein
MGKRILLVEDDAGLRVRVLLGVLAVLLLAEFAAGCGLASDLDQARSKEEGRSKSSPSQARGEGEGRGPPGGTSE